MKKIIITNYIVNVKNQKGEEIKLPYDVKGSIKNVLFNPALQLNSSGLFESMEVWNKIKDKNIEVILEDANYNYLKKCLDTFKGYSENDYEFVKRIKEAEDIKVKEDKEDNEIKIKS